LKIASYTIIRVIIFSVAMGYVEASVVVYLREIYYPSGFAFPLKPIQARDVAVELCREAATLIMLVSIALLSGATKAQRLAFFLLSFGVWDLSYYLFLKIILGWPAGLLTWDILFLLPVLWVGPVLAPCILSLTMILLAFMILRTEQQYGRVIFSAYVPISFMAGSLVVIASFCEDPLRHLSAFKENAPVYIPTSYWWWLFILGEGIILSGIYQLYRSQKKNTYNRV
jgi:hypothetical protein